MKKTSSEKKPDALLAAAFEKLPERLTWPKCGRRPTKDAFGLRVMAATLRACPWGSQAELLRGVSARMI